MVHHHFDEWVRWVCRTFSQNPIESVELGAVSGDGQGRPVVSYQVVLRDGRRLAGSLPFAYQPRQNRWMGAEGIDWHLQVGSDRKPAAEPQSGAPAVKP